MQALNAQYDRDVAGREELDEESKRPLLKQIREMKAELRDERKQRAITATTRSELRGGLQGLEQEVEMANKVKEDAVKQYKKLAAQIEDCQREVEKARIALEEMAAAVKDNDKRVKNLETEPSMSLKLQNQRLVIERQDKETRDKPWELEGHNRAPSKATIATLESKIVKVEEQLDQEAKRTCGAGSYQWQDGRNAAKLTLQGRPSPVSRSSSGLF
ncbi:hypothetical protein C0Q70_02251 [Pomacea canaliculata]|uniref:Myosin tail domain-containing protein n=1 Tax=Pomacea canaliculata TaxID=400727 RepID=A0A2T7PPE6_POMCA|nr:hypothetical protein C0Q70_02251 [Pomacea canaliculata]